MVKKKFDSHGGVWIFKSFLRSNIIISLQSQKGDWKIALHKFIKWAGRIIAYLRSSIVTSYKVKKGDWRYCLTNGFVPKPSSLVHL